MLRIDRVMKVLSLKKKNILKFFDFSNMQMKNGVNQRVFKIFKIFFTLSVNPALNDYWSTLIQLPGSKNPGEKGLNYFQNVILS